MSKKIIGIDLGTGNSCVAVLENGTPTVIVNSEGQRTTPSVVSYKGNDILVGKTAQNMQVTNPKSTAFSVKRFMGRKYDEAIKDVKRMPYECRKASNGDVRLVLNGNEKSPEEVSAQILMKMKKTAEDYLGETVTEAVITVPAYFNDTQRQATKDAGKIAGLEVKRIVNEPTAAAMAFGLKEDEDKKVAVVDIGCGTSDFTVLDIGDGVYEVKSTAGDSQLGGWDFDQAIIDYLVNNFKANSGIDLSGDPMALQRLKEAAEKAKIELSSSTSTDINLPFITADATGPKHLQDTLTRAKFEQLIAPYLERLKTPCLQAIKDSGYTTNQIDEVLLVGGSTRVPAVYELIKSIFGKEPNKSVNPDEAVAMGAAIQAGVLSGEVKDILLLDVTPLSLGIETMGGVMTKLIERNTTVPTSKTQIFSTATDNQTAVTVHVLQGERSMARDCKSLGQFNLEGIPLAPRGVPQIEVKLSLDANSILTVTAKDLGTGKEQSITITGGSGLTDAEIEQAVNDAKAHEAEDKRIKEKIDTRNEAESLIFSTRKALKDYGDKLTTEEKSKVETAVNDLEEYLKTEHEAEDIKKKIQETTEASYIIGQKMYEKANPNGQAGSVPHEFEEMFKNAQAQYKQTPPNQGPQTPPTDADYEIVDD